MKLFSPLLVLLLASSVYSLDSRWKLLWADEFNGNSLDTTKWTARERGGYSENGQLEFNLPEHVYVQNGVLIIRSVRDTSRQGYSYASGYLDTQGKFSSTFGRYEVRARLPSGKGLWPAHWLLSETKCWPEGYEIDIMEHVNNPVNEIHGTIHYGPSCGVKEGQNGTAFNTGTNPSSSFHIYSVEWNENSITWYFDDVVYKTVNKNSFNNGNPYPMEGSPHYIILNTAVGGWWPGNPDSNNVFPQYHYIDYVRVYGWEPCEGGCGHGCCDEGDTCKCDDGYTGSKCEYSVSGEYYLNSFNAVTAGDQLADNAAINGGLLTLTVSGSGCPGNCGGQKGKGGKWISKDPFSFGNYSFTVRTSKTPATQLLLWGVTQGSTFAGFQLSISNNGERISFQTFGLPSGNGNSASLGFDSSAAYHTYTVSYTDVFTVYVDGRFYFSSTSATTTPLYMQVSYEFNEQYWGTFVGTLPVSVSATQVEWKIASTKKAQCSNPNPTPKPTTKPTTKPTPKPTSSPCPAFQSNFAARTSNDVMPQQTLIDGGLVRLTNSKQSIANGKLTLTLDNNGCPSACGGALYASGGWETVAKHGYGTYQFTATGPSQAGTALLMGITGGSGSAIRIFLRGSTPNQIYFDVFSNNVQHNVGSFNLPFAHTAGSHRYSFTYTSSSISFYADAVLVKTFSIVPTTIQMSFRATYEAHTSWFGGAFSYSSASSVSITSVSYRGLC